MDESAFNLLSADMSEEEYLLYEQKRNSLVSSIQDFEPPLKSIRNVDIRMVYDSLPCYQDVPLRDESKGDLSSTVASSGGALLVAEFIGQYFGCNFEYDIPDMAKKVTSLGYIGYNHNSNGSWENIGIKPVFFDEFVPRFYGLDSESMVNINDITFGIWYAGLPVLLIRDSIYKGREDSTDTRFIIIVGYEKSKKQYLVYDPNYCFIKNVPYDTINNSIYNGWVFMR